MANDSPVNRPIPIILDTDIGQDIDDTWAIAMMLRCPELDVKLIVSDTGDTEYRARIVAKLLEVAGRTDIPVGVGVPCGHYPQPQAGWVEGYDLARYPGTVHQDGVNAMIETIMASPEPVTLIAIGPVPNLAEALRRVLRQDPDVILVGELRDLETMESALRAAETGHLVFGTLHTTGAQGTITRIVDQFPVTQQEQIRVQLSTNLIAVLSQALLPRSTSGRVAAFEFMVITPAIANLIRENKVFRIDSSIQTGKKYGMQLLDDHLWQLFESGIVKAEEMLDKSKNPGELKRKLDAARPGSAVNYGMVLGADNAAEEEKEAS